MSRLFAASNVNSSSVNRDNDTLFPAFMNRKGMRAIATSGNFLTTPGKDGNKSFLRRPGKKLIYIEPTSNPFL